MMISIVSAVLAFIPPMAANSLAVVFGGGTPIDLGRKIGGKRIFGDGKTWKGLIGGGVFASLIGLFLSFITKDLLSLYPLDMRGVMIIVVLSFGALFGDIGASFIKRRLGRKRGEKTPFLDQYDFVIGTFVLGFLFYSKWMYKNYVKGYSIIATIIILIAIPLLHRSTNYIGYKIGMKKEPW
ncbi:MAG: CDP-2,3-bis-(O-geranylgeranyl)-sn-glycerol synthase [Thermoplasmatota archaeon]